ncbi:hypothetical protein L2E82_35575 [Cichorium intybus]|uniref:Uncharacterized protein n=1 Tax=Cichorium intybus TaxID=13427 RepID=A0ACB9BP63_CICIN|nr:hypothetical protein L2E82_35575 [Cichorium intybus]
MCFNLGVDSESRFVLVLSFFFLFGMRVVFDLCGTQIRFDLLGLDWFLFMYVFRFWCSQVKPSIVRWNCNTGIVVGD